MRRSVCRKFANGLQVGCLLLLATPLWADPPAADSTAANAAATAVEVGPLNLPFSTGGGKQFWTDVDYCQGWRIQQNAVTGHCRLLDPSDVRHAWGTLGQCQVKLGEVEEIWYSSLDDYKIQGWVIKPPDFDPKKKYPLMLSIHGGPHSMYGVGFNFAWQEHAANGYVVLYTNPRGSTGYGSSFGNAIKYNYPSKDFDDLMKGVDTVLAKGYVDERNMFVYGCSGGGVLTAWTVGHTDRFAAAASQCPVINWISFVGNVDAPEVRRLHRRSNALRWPRRLHSGGGRRHVVVPSEQRVVVASRVVKSISRGEVIGKVPPLEGPAVVIDADVFHVRIDRDLIAVVKVAEFHRHEWTSQVGPFQSGRVDVLIGWRGYGHRARRREHGPREHGGAIL